MSLICSKGKIELRDRPETLVVSQVSPDPHYAGYQVCRTGRQFTTLAEPLLVKSLKALGNLIGQPEKTHEWYLSELRAQKFITDIWSMFRKENLRKEKHEKISLSRR